jgi:tetratricopeptide (TPR) repeat protein
LDRLKQLIHEIHRRSLWQVLGIYLVASWAVLQVADTMASALGLPDWFPPLALALLVVGLPIVLATAFVQEGTRSREPGLEVIPETGSSASTAGSVPSAGLSPGTGSLDRPRTHTSRIRRLLTWRNAIAGGVVAFAGLGVVVTAYWVMWATGIGPVGSLVAQGVIEDGERVVLARFDDATGENLGNVVTEALRIDLLQASVIALVETSDVEPVLGRMERPVATPLTAELAREVAIREGIPAVLDGEVAAAGTGYILTATLRAAETGRSLANFRVTADGPDEIIPAIETLSSDIREKSGESLRSIRGGTSLAQVTTNSLEALQLFTEAVQAFDRADDRVRSAALLQQALEQDSTFAMAWRQLVLALQGSGEATRSREAISRAFQHRDRLQELERYLVEAQYHASITKDPAEVIAAYENALRIDPDNASALNNLSLWYRQRRGDFARAEELLRRAVDGPGRTSTAYGNLLVTLLRLGRTEEAETVLQDLEAAYPDLALLPVWRSHVAFLKGDLEAARRHLSDRAEDPSLSDRLRSGSAADLARLTYWSGRLAEGRELALRAERLAAEVSPALEWSERVFTAYDEALAGDPAWARDHLRRGLEDGTFQALGPSEQFHFRTATAFAFSGDPEGAELVITNWAETTPDEMKTRADTAAMMRAALYARAARGDTTGVREAYQTLLRDWGCDSCWRLERAWLHERLQDPELALELYERLREGWQWAWRSQIGEPLHARLRLGPLYEQVGDTARAIEAYQRMVDQWANGDERGTARVEEWRARIAALGG